MKLVGQTFLLPVYRRKTFLKDTEGKWCFCLRSHIKIRKMRCLLQVSEKQMPEVLKPPDLSVSWSLRYK